MNNTRHPRQSTRRQGLRRLLPMAAAFAATMLAAPGHAAILIPDLPLQTGSAYPPPNIRFILDDSGSMALDYMPDDVPNTTGIRIETQAYTRNTIYYNPYITYQAWIDPNDNSQRLTGGTSYTSAYTSDNYASGSTTNLSNNTQTFYVPKTGATLSDGTQYYRYQIASGGADIVRSEYGAVTKTNVTAVAVTPATGSVNNSSQTHSLNAVAANLSLDVVITSTNSRTANYDVRNPSGTSVCSGSVNNSSDTCTVSPTVAGVYTVRMSRGNNNAATYALSASTYTNNRCPGTSGSPTWINCTSTRPTQPDGSMRSIAAEEKNFAIWYSYYRTRMKVAKGSASEAFAQLGTNVRVGLNTIWNRTDYRIPVGTNGGIFDGSNRSDWFTRLQNDPYGSGSTPLHDALKRAGDYFSETAVDGPWGPGTGANQLTCRQNFSILTTDGYWNSRSNGSGANSYYGNEDNTNGTTINPPAGSQVQPYTYTASVPYKDAYSSTLADVAMHFWKNDLRTDMANNVPSTTADPAFWQHMVTFSVSIGAAGTLDPSQDLPSIQNGTLNWTDPDMSNTSGSASVPERIDDLWHASVNGRGNFVLASNPLDFAQGLLDALATVQARLGSASNVTANSTSFQTDTRVYQASYVSGSWVGELAAYDVSAAGVSTVDLINNDSGAPPPDGLPDPVWQASRHIPAVASRKVFTFGASSGTTFPTASQITSLDKSTRALSPVTGVDNAAYVKGDSTNERRNGGKLRNRSKTVLGDITNSSPMYVGDSKTLFVGANDGMLHAFAAAARPSPSTVVAGQELFAYVPTGIDFAQLATLSDPEYVHRYFVDGPVVVSNTTQTPGKNYLIGALGRGGRGVYGLDVTTPDSFGPSNVMWDKTGTTLGNNMGYVLGEPLIVKLNTGDDAVVVSNGINSPNGDATLFVLKLSDGSKLAEIDTGDTTDNGLAAPRGADINGDGKVDYIYAGDLQGNVWKFDLTDTSTASNFKVANSGSPLFVAKDATNVRQPITAGVAIAREPTTNRIWVFVGTGSFMTTSDLTSTQVQSMYGLVDEGTIGARSELQQRTILVSTTSNSKPVRGFEPNSGLPSGKKGWYIDLDKPTAGERIVSNPRVKGGVLLTASLIPPPSSTSCAAEGTGYINALDAFSGTSLPQPFFDINNDGKFDTSDQVSSGSTNVPIGSVDLGIGMPTLPTMIDKLLVVGGSKGILGSIKVNPQGGSARRISWHEILKD